MLKFVNKTFYVPTLKTFFILFIIATFSIFLLIYTFLINIQDYLSFNTTPKSKSEIIVLDGWLPDYALDYVIDNKINEIYITGTNIEIGSYLSKYKNFADLTRYRLIARGFNKDFIIPVPTGSHPKNRSYFSCLELKKHLTEKNIYPKSITLITLGVHGRRSALIYKKVFGENIKINITSIPSKSYSKKYWWKSSSGLKITITELISYLFECFFDSGRKY